MSSGSATNQELIRIRRVTDMLCTGHAALRARYARLAFQLDLLILGASTWLIALTFVEPRLNVALTPFGLNPQLWVGALGTFVFFLTLVQMKTDWKGRSDAHKRALEVYAEVKRRAAYLLSSGKCDDSAVQYVISLYEMACAVGITIPEKEFLAQKQRHLVKVMISRVLDAHPATCLLCLRVRLLMRDTFFKLE